MNYMHAFRHLFSFGAHAALSAADAGDGGLDARAVFAELESHINTARSRRKPENAENFDSAWFAMTAWLDEKLTPLRTMAGSDPNTRLQRRFFNTVNAGEEFFTHLDQLLEKQNQDPDTDRADVIDLYGACIELGFRGKHYLPEEQVNLEEYRRLCHESHVKAYGGSQDSRLLQNEPADGERMDKPASMLVFWIVPVTVTFGMFLLYRLLLSSIYGQVVN